MRVRPLDDLAVHLQDQSQHAMGGGMLRAEIDRMGIDLDGLGGLGFGLAHDLPPTFSSPGKVVIASHGERKSKLRKSCTSLTGS